MHAPVYTFVCLHLSMAPASLETAAAESLTHERYNQVLCLEGLATTLQPTYNILDGARPLLQGYNKLTKNLFPVALILKRFVDHRTYQAAVHRELSAKQQPRPARKAVAQRQ